MHRPSYEVSFAEGITIVNNSCSKYRRIGTKRYKIIDKELCEKFILDFIPELIADKYSCLLTTEKLENIWKILYYPNKVSGISYETFNLRCHQVVLRKHIRDSQIITGSILRRQIIGKRF
jgi:hypothetical protein